MQLLLAELRRRSIVVQLLLAKLSVRTGASYILHDGVGK